MKKTFSLALCIILLLSCFVLPVKANVVTDNNIEYLEDGSYFVIELEELASSRSTTKTFAKEATYYTATGVAVFKIKLTATFTYNYGVSASATNATCNVELYKSAASIIAQNAYTSGKTAYAYTGIDYLGDTLYKEVKLTCDKYGNIT